MEYESFDSSGTDDDLPPAHRVPRGGGRVTGNGRPSNLLPPPYPKMYDDAEMEAQIHQIEKEAYISILRAFTAQADAITWEKESLITELRKELRLSNEEHRELLGRVNVDETIRRIRDWRKSGGMQPGMRNVSHVVHDALQSPSVSVSLKKHKPNQPMPSQSFIGSSPSFHPQADPMHQFTPSAAKRGGSVPNVKGKKHKPVFPGSSSAKPVPFHPPEQNPRGQSINRIQPGPTSSSEPINGSGPESFVGRRVRTRWPEDNTFYEAVITTYNPADGLHALVYDIGTPSETWEWVNLSEISPEDIEWIGEDPGIANRYGYNGQNRPKGPNNVPQRGSVLPKNTIRKDFRTVQNGGIGKKKQPEIRIRQTNVVIREVERIFESNTSNPQEIQWAKRILEEQENALVGAIAKLGEFSDGESEGRFHR